jgi:hypothetical protein
VNFQAELQEFKGQCKLNLALRDEALAKVGEEQKALEQVQTDLQVVSAALGGAALPPQIEATTSQLEWIELMERVRASMKEGKLEEALVSLDVVTHSVD